MKTIAVISDLHIGDRTKTDDFLIDEEKLVQFLELLLTKVSVIIINGDLFECWQPKSWDAQVEQFHKIMRKRYHFIGFLKEMIEKGKIVYVNGNHDGIVRTRGLIGGVVSKYIVEYSGRKLLFEHGHLGDKANSGSLNVLGRSITWLIGWLERFGWADADKDFARIEKTIIPGGGSDNNLDAYARAKLIEGYDLVCLGHTHISLRKEGYINSGCAMENPIDITTILINDAGVIQVSQSPITI